MCWAILLLILLPSLAVQTKLDVWKQVNPNSSRPHLQSAILTEVQQRAVARVLLRCCQSDFNDAQENTPAHIAQCLSFQEVPLTSEENVLLVSEGEPCFRGGNGGGGPMWLIRLAADVPIMLASPERDFYGSLYSIQPSATHGFYDLVLGWHMSAFETDVTYFQFDGTSYISVSKAAVLCDEHGLCRIDPTIPTNR